MGDSSWPRHGRRQPGGGSRRPWRPHLPRPDHGHNQCPVPLWEREFCKQVGNISWERFCEDKRYAHVYHNIQLWDDSGAFENFESAKARFYAAYHGEPCDIPLPDPDMYIDEVDHQCTVDPQLVAGLDEAGLTFEQENNSAHAAIALADIEPTGWGDALADIEPTGWGDPPVITSTGWGDAPVISSSGWGADAPVNTSYSWGAAPEKPSWSSNQYPSSNRNNNFYGGSNNRGNRNNNFYGGSYNYNRGNNRNNNYGGSSSNRGNKNNNFYGGSSNKYQQEDPSRTSGRKQREGGRFQQRQHWQKNQDGGGHQGSSSWKNRGGRKEWRPVQKTACQTDQGAQGGP